MKQSMQQQNMDFVLLSDALAGKEMTEGFHHNIFMDSLVLGTGKCGYCMRPLMEL
jgi:hypothetical protein